MANHAHECKTFRHFENVMKLIDKRASVAGLFVCKQEDGRK